MSMEDQVKKVVEFFRGVNGPFRLYPNPMRSDGVFIGEDKEIQPYPGVRSINGPLYPATPQGAKTYPTGLPHDVADKVLEALKARPKRSKVSNLADDREGEEG
jgi:hypothetical protein